MSKYKPWDIILREKESWEPRGIWLILFAFDCYSTETIRSAADIQNRAPRNRGKEYYFTLDRHFNIWTDNVVWKIWTLIWFDKWLIKFQ